MIISSCVYLYTIFHKQDESSLTDQQKRILAAALTALATLSLLYATRYFYLRAREFPPLPPRKLRIRDGVAFFKEFILNPGQIDEETKAKILECDPSSTLFVFTRSLYVYIMGPKKNEQLPSFFKLETRQLINELRKKYINYDGEIIKPLMRSLLAFESSALERGEDNTDIKTILNDIKKITYTEMPGSLFIKCWQKSCDDLFKTQLTP